MTPHHCIVSPIPPPYTVEIEGEQERRTVKNLAMAIFSASLLPLTSARAVSFMAGGPVGMSMRQNQSMGSWGSQFVLAATA